MHAHVHFCADDDNKTDAAATPLPSTPLGGSAAEAAASPLPTPLSALPKQQETCYEVGNKLCAEEWTTISLHSTCLMGAIYVYQALA